MATAVRLALARQNGVEGGVWQADAGPLAYAFPTYAGTGPKTDLPAAERDYIQAVNEQASRDERPVNRRSVSREQYLLLYACPLSGPIPRLTAWTMTGSPLLRSTSPRPQRSARINGADVSMAQPRADRLGAVYKRHRGRRGRRRRR
jgi:hypothetical protein